VQLSVCFIAYSYDLTLPAALFGKVWAAGIWHPDLHGSKSCHAQALAVLAHPDCYFCHV
jgi:hypothetical protein